MKHCYEDFFNYYARAKLLEDRNHHGGKVKRCRDPLQDNVTIYDTVHRRYAGFSNVLRDLHEVGSAASQLNSPPAWALEQWLYVYGIHRMTGSGASFYPKTEGDRRHGYCNVIVPSLRSCATIPQMAKVIRDWKGPMFTSLGNQPPPFPRPVGEYETGGRWFFCEVWPSFVPLILAELLDNRGSLSVAEFTDWMLELNCINGFKRFKFAYTAFVMDIADWHPEFISPRTRCYYGANCATAINAMLSENNNCKADSFYHQAMEKIQAELVVRKLCSSPCPMDVEDVLCDCVRYWSGFVPRHGYQHLSAEERRSVSLVDRKSFCEFAA